LATGRRRLVVAPELGVAAQRHQRRRDARGGERAARRDPRAETLFRVGNRNAKAIVPLSDTGTWSLYSIGGPESTLEYHALLRDFLKTLCRRRGVTLYCDTADRFTQYLALRSG
jgi:hypothetical protein